MRIFFFVSQFKEADEVLLAGTTTEAIALLI